MSAPLIHGSHRFVPASDIRAALGDALSRIRQEDRLTWVDMGDALGKSDDQAAKYADGSAEMGVVAFYRAKTLWNGRFSDGADKLVGDNTVQITAHYAQSCILKAALALSEALEDGELTDQEIFANRTALQASRDAIDAILGRLSPRDVA